MKPAQLAKALLGQAVTGVLPLELVTTDRILDRWSVNANDGLPKEDRKDDTPVSKPPPLDDDTQQAVYECLKLLSAFDRDIVWKWYTKGWATVSVAEYFDLSRDGMYRHHARVLIQMKRLFLASKCQDLVRLVTQRVGRDEAGS